MAPRPAMEESHRGVQSVILPGQFVRLATALAIFLFAPWSAPESNATPLRSSLGQSCHGVQVAPGDDLQGLIDSASSSKHILFRARHVSAFRDDLDRQQVPEARPTSRCRDRRRKRQL